MAAIRVERRPVGSRPTGLLLKDDELSVLEAGDATVSTYDLRSGRPLRRIRLPDGVNPYLRFTSLGGTLMAGPRDEAYAWTATTQSTVYSVDRGEARRRGQLGPYSLRDWAYAAAAGKLIITQYGDRAVHFIPSHGRYVRPHLFGFEPGTMVVPEDGRKAYLADAAGENVYGVDARSESIMEIIPAGSTVAGAFPGSDVPQPGFLTAPVALSHDQRFLYVCPLRTDAAELRTPLLLIDLAGRFGDVVSDEGIRFPYSVLANPRGGEVYVSGYDETVAVDVTRRRVTRALGPGRLTGFRIAPSGEWAVGVDVYNETIFVFNLRRRITHTVPLAGNPEGGEFIRVPIVVAPDSTVAVVADIPANRVVIVAIDVG